MKEVTAIVIKYPDKPISVKTHFLLAKYFTPEIPGASYSQLSFNNAIKDTLNVLTSNLAQKKSFVYLLLLNYPEYAQDAINLIKTQGLLPIKELNFKSLLEIEEFIPKDY